MPNTARKLDPVDQQVYARNAVLEEEKARLLEENANLRASIRKIRLWAGDNLPAREGTTVIVMLEKALGGE